MPTLRHLCGVAAGVARQTFTDEQTTTGSATPLPRRRNMVCAGRLRIGFHRKMMLVLQNVVFAVFVSLLSQWSRPSMHVNALHHSASRWQGAAINVELNAQARDNRCCSNLGQLRLPLWGRMMFIIRSCRRRARLTCCCSKNAGHQRSPLLDSNQT